MFSRGRQVKSYRPTPFEIAYLLSKEITLARETGDPESPAKLKTKGVEAVDKALRILSLFEMRNAELSLGDISQGMGLGKSSVLRLLVSLMEAGFVTVGPNKRYMIGPEAFRVGRIYQQNSNLEPVIRPVLKQMVRETGESASFFQREGRRRVCLFREDSDQLLREHVAEGDAVEIGKGAAGRVFVEYERTSGAKPASDAVLAALPVVSIGERGPGIAGLSVPIFDMDGAMIGALSLSGPSTRFTQERIQEMGPVLMHGARAIGTGLRSRFYESVGS